MRTALPREIALAPIRKLHNFLYGQLLTRAGSLNMRVTITSFVPRVIQSGNIQSRLPALPARAGWGSTTSFRRSRDAAIPLIYPSEFSSSIIAPPAPPPSSHVYALTIGLCDRVSLVIAHFSLSSRMGRPLRRERSAKWRPGTTVCGFFRGCAIISIQFSRRTARLYGRDVRYYRGLNCFSRR